MKRYDAYKSTGIPWIPEVPEHWEVDKIRKHFKQRVEMVSDKDYPPLSVTKDGILPQLDTAVKTLYGDKRKLVLQGDYVVNSRSDRKGSCGISPFDGSVSLINIVMPSMDGEQGYYHLLFRSNDFIEEFYRNGRGIVADLWTTRYQEMKNIEIPFPPLSEQRAIVAYVERKGRQIDAYIARQAEQIERLKELRQTIISHAVTCGIHPYTRFRPTGIPWIPEVPEHWEVDKIRKHFKQRVETVSDKDYPPLSVTKDGVLPQLDTAVKTLYGDKRKLVLQGDYVVNSRSDRKGSCGISPFDGSVSLINIVMPSMDGEQGYYHLLFRSNDFIEEFYRNGRGIVADLWTTRYQEMKNIEIPFPPLSEQRAIVAYIEKKTAAVDRMINACREQTELMKAYKQRLISDAVTGRIRVPEK
ncbi:hypothetical protein BHU09_06815 [Tannerella sp. oral taxon 808]|nr:hypothetical protein BHU09_06815 [Tannerella sp. oral taxon 808]